jgi:general secretion pathway protein G
MNHTKAGFTLIELIVVIAVIAVLTGIIVPVVGSMLEEARATRARSEVKVLAEAILTLYKDTTFWPQDVSISSIDAWNHSRNALLGRPTPNSLYPGWKGPYILRRVEVDPWGTPYYYDGNGRTNATSSGRGPGRKSVMSYGSNKAENGSLNRNDMQAQGDDIVYYFEQ